jgi:hypothetical protein
LRSSGQMCIIGVNVKAERYRQTNNNIRNIKSEHHRQGIHKLRYTT